MHITLVMVISADGRITKWDGAGAESWVSPEDQMFFETLKASHSLIIMGGKTYDHAKSSFKHRDGLLRVVLTRQNKRSDARGIEFSSLSPDELIAEFEKRGYKNALLVGGSEINAAFLKDGLINEIYLTVEPKIFGDGLPLAQTSGLDVELELINAKQLNHTGTLLLHYRVK